MDKTEATMDLASLAIGITIFAVIGFVGLYMLQTTANSITFGVAAAGSSAGNRWNNSSASLLYAVQIFYDNSVIVILAVILAVVIGYLLMVRQR
jgi:hypothetical protein